MLRSFRTSGFERLEPRHTMSGISAVLHRSGVLSIKATDDADIITVNTTATKLKLVETGQTFDLRRVKSIEAVLGGEDDVFIHNNKFDGMTPWGEIPTKLKSIGGSDSFRGIDGRVVYFGGSQDTLTVDRRGNVKIDGHKPDWFNYNVPQNAVGILVRKLAKDKSLSFNDMEKIFKLAADEAGSGAIGYQTFAALRAIVRRDRFFREQYVQALSGYVMFPTPANAYFVERDDSSGDYVEVALGNLSAKRSGDHLDKLVDKWFRGLDRPIPHSQAHPIESTEYREAAGSLFKGDPTLHQIHQGGDGDCYFMSSLAAILIHDPETIENMFEVNQIGGRTVYTVVFHSFLQGGKEYYVTVDTQLPVISSGPHADYFAFDDSELRYDNPHNVLWSAYAEKAYVQLVQFGWSRGNKTQNSYESIRGGSPVAALEQITGQQATGYSIPFSNVVPVSPRNVAKILAAFRGGQPVTFSTRDPSGDSKIVPNHVYAMVDYSVGTAPGNVQFLLFNPWGFGDPDKPGLIWRTWEQIVHSFDGWAAGSTLTGAMST